MSDGSPLIRQWCLLRMLSARRNGLTVCEMADESGVDRKTIRRDLDAFREAGLPLEELVGEHGRKSWRITVSWGQPPLAFAFDEALALYLGRRFLEPLAGTLFWDAAQRAYRKLRASLGAPALEYLRRFCPAIHLTTLGCGDYTSHAERIDELMLAIEDGKVARIAYQSERATEPASREVHPYGLAYHRGTLYLIAFAPEHRQVRHYKVDRISSVESGTGAFERPEGFDLAAHLDGAFGVYCGTGDVTVRVRFRPDAARYVLESRWHAGQRLTRLADGGVVAEFRLSSTAEIRSWVLSFGAKAVVLEPEGLRREIAEELRAMAAAYGPDVSHPEGSEPEPEPHRDMPRRN